MSVEVHGFTQNGCIDATIDGARWIIPDDPENRFRVMVSDWEDEGNTIPPYSPLPPSIDQFEEAIQGLVDETARTKQFRDGGMLATYVASTNSQWSAEAKAFVAWRDCVWGYAYAELAKVMSSERSQPSISEFLSEIQPIQWPL